MGQTPKLTNEQKANAVLMTKLNNNTKALNLKKNVFGGTDSTIAFGGFNYKDRGFEPAAKEGDWSVWSLPDNMAQQAYEEQDWKETIKEMGIGFTKQVGAGFLDSIGAWDASNITTSNYKNGEIAYSNWFNQMGSALKKSSQEENHIYQDPNESMWNGAYFANQIQSLGYTGGIIAQMFGENLLLDAVTGGAFAGASAAKGAKLIANIGKDALFGVAQGIKEAHMNALETQNTVFQKFVSNGYSEEEALAKSKDAAKLHFKTESTALMGINALQNVLFLGSFARSAKSVASNAFNREGTKLSLGISDAFENAGKATVGKITTNKTAQKIAGWGLLSGSEAIEEVIQTGIGTYAERKVSGKETSLSDIFEGNDARDSAIGGALGAIVMGAGFKAVANYRNKDFNKNYKNFIEDSINMTSGIYKAQDAAKTEYNAALEAHDTNPTPATKKALQSVAIKLQKANHNAALGGVMASLNFDYSKGNGSTVAFDMQVAHMESVLEAVNNKDMKALETFGLIDADSGKERFEGSLKSIKDNYKKNIDTANLMKKYFNETLGSVTTDFTVASDIVRDKINNNIFHNLQEETNSKLDVLKKSDENYKRLSPQAKERFDLENELLGINKFVENQDHTLVQQRKQEIQERLDTLEKYNTVDSNIVNMYKGEDTEYSMAYGSTMNIQLAIADNTQELLKNSDPKEIKNKITEKTVKTLRDSKDVNEVKQAIAEAKNHGVYNTELETLAKAKLKALKVQEAANKVTTKKSTKAPVVVDPVVEVKEETSIVQEKIKEPTAKNDAVVSLFGGANAGKFTSEVGVDSTTETDVDAALENSVESLAQNAFEDTSRDQEIKEAFQDMYQEISEDLGREATHEDLVKDFIAAYGKAKTKELLSGLEKGTKLVGKQVSDTSNLFNTRAKIVDLLEDIKTNTEETSVKFNQDQPKNTRTNATNPNKEDASVPRGTNVGANKMAITNSYNAATDRYRHSELEGSPVDNTVRFFLKPGDQLQMALAENYGDQIVPVMDRTDPTNPKRANVQMTFNEFMEWITTPEATSLGYKQLEKGSAEWQNMWESKVPMTYHLIDSNGEPELRVAGIVHDVEWWNRNNVDQREDPVAIALQGAKATHQERRRYFREDLRVATVTSVNDLGNLFFTVKMEKDAAGNISYVSNVDTGEMYMSLEEATGETRLGVVTSADTVTLEDGSTIKIGQTYPGTNQPILLNQQPFVSAGFKTVGGIAVEVRKIREIDGNPVYMAFLPMRNSAAQGETLNDTSFDMVKFLMIAKIYNSTASQEVKEYIKQKYGYDTNSVTQIEKALENARLGGLGTNFSEVLENFIMTSNAVSSTEDKNYTEISAAPKFIKVGNAGRVMSLDYTTADVAKVEQFLDFLIGEDNQGVLRNTTLDISKNKLKSKGPMFTIDPSGKVQPFQSAHGQNTYAGFAKTLYKTSVKSFEAMEKGPGNTTQWITDIQPMIYLSNSVVQEKVPEQTQEGEVTMDVNETSEDVNTGMTEQQKAILKEAMGEEAYELFMNNNNHSFGESEARNEFTDTDAENLNILRVPGVSNKELADTANFLFNSVLSTIVQNDNNTVKPRLIYDRLQSSPEQFLNDKIKEKRSVIKNLEPNRAIMGDIIAKMELEATKLEAIVANKQVVLAKLKAQLDELFQTEFALDAVTEGVIDSNGDYQNDIFDEDFDFGEQIETDYSKMSTEKDIRLTYSTALKIAFAGVQAVNLKGAKISGEFNLPVYLDINETSEIVKALIVGLPSNTKGMLTLLKESGELNTNNKLVQSVSMAMYNKLKDAPQHVLNEMLYKLAQQKLNMEMVIYSKDEKSGRFTLKVQNTNSNSDLHRLRDQWKNNFSNSPFITLGEGSEKALNKEYLKNFYNRLDILHNTAAERVAKGEEKEVREEAYQMLQDLGINIGKNTLENIWSLGLISDKQGLFGLIKKEIEPLTKKEEILTLSKEENLFLENTINNQLKLLAVTDLKLNSALATPSQRIAGKSFPGTSQRIMLDDISEGLYDTTSTYFKFLEGAALSKDNYMLDIFKNTDFIKEIENAYTTVSPLAIKEQGKKDFGDNSIDKLSETDRILTELAYFQQDLKKDLSVAGTDFNAKDIKFRIGKMFPPALSDKGRMVAIATALMNLKEENFVINGNDVTLSDNVLDFMATNLFDSEFNRIVYSYSNKTNIKNYEEASKAFIAIPAFNDIEVDGVKLFDLMQDRGTNLAPQDRGSAFEELRTIVREQAKAVISNVVTADLNKKIQNNEEGAVIDGTWVKAGFITNGDTGVQVKYLDSLYLNNKFKDSELTQLQRSKIAALDYIANHLVSQNNIYQLYIGDMALYAPGKKAYMNEEGLQAYDLSYKTGESITKRIASLIAPGNVLANSVLDNGMSSQYHQIFVNDIEAPSSIIEEYVKMVNNGKIPSNQEEAIEQFRSGNADIRQEGIDTLKKMNPIISNYFNIEGTDAQEYTTWKEHLDVLFSQGRITAADKARLTVNITMDRLTEEDLKIILNPLKPVYAGMIQDTEHNVNRFVYIKSSSFPLIPQLTKGLKLDKVRLAMEKLESEGKNVRMSYQTANKVGSVKTTLNMQDFYDSDESTIADLIETKIKPNTLSLNRNSFKVQQDTPYKGKKYMAMNKDTQTTMGSQMFKLLLGAGINEMGAVFPNIFSEGVSGIKADLLTGAELDAIKTDIETKYMQLQESMLADEIGLSTTEDYFSLPDNRKQKVFKNLVDVLKNEIKTRNYDKALLKELEIDETGLQTNIPIWLTNNADKFESLFLSIIKNRFISIKLPGNGHIVGSSEGFERVEGFNNLTSKVKSSIVWVDPNHKGDLKATYIKDVDGKKVLSESEILVQSHYIVSTTDDKGVTTTKKIDLLSDEYSTATEGGRVLKLDKIDPELLTNFSFRIPTSALQSGALLKVVGFLPEASGDLLVVPDEHTVQIGEDFDIDKRNLYKSNYRVDETGKIVKLTKEYIDNNYEEGKDKNKMKVKFYENAMIDTYKAVYSSTNLEVQKKIFRVLSMANAESTANLIDNKINSVTKETYTFLSDDVQRKQMKSGTSGKLGTAMHSNAVTFQAQMERLAKDKKLTVTYTDAMGEQHPKEVTIGKFTSDGVLGKIETLDGHREINAVHAENQNSAVDNVKAQIMAKRNENSYTMPVLIQLTYRGFDMVPFTKDPKVKSVQVSSLFLSQPILRRFVELMEETKSITAEYSADAEATVLEKLAEEFHFEDGYIMTDEDYDAQSKLMTGDNLYENLEGETSNLLQIAVLRKFLELRTEAEQVQDIQKVLSLSSSGLGKSYFDVLERVEKLNDLPQSSVKNAVALIGQYEVYDSNLDPARFEGFISVGDYMWKPTTSEGAMLLYSLKNAQQIMDVNYPYNRNIVNETLNKVIAEKGTPLRVSNSVDFKWKVLKSFKDFLGSNPSLNYFVGDIEEERARLFSSKNQSGFKATPYNVEVNEGEVSIFDTTQMKRVNVPGTSIRVTNAKGEVIQNKTLRKDSKNGFRDYNGVEQYVVPNDFKIKKNADGTYTYMPWTTQKSKSSLGDYIFEMKQKRNTDGTLVYPIFGNNTLLKSLDLVTDTKVDNGINIIKHSNASTVDLSIVTKNDYFLQMLDDNTTQLDTWNGEVMTPRKLAQDLASYAMLANQENGAIGFRQFVDMEYLKAVGYDKHLRDVLDRYSNSIAPTEVFLKQYYQHNPEQAMILSPTNIQLSNFGNLDEDSLKIKNSGSKNALATLLGKVKNFTLYDNANEPITKKFISIRDTSVKTSDNQYRLFEYQGPYLGYGEVSILGTFGYNEFNPNNYNQNSTLHDKVYAPISLDLNDLAHYTNGATQVFNFEVSDVFDSSSAYGLLDSIKNLNPTKGVKDTLDLIEGHININTKIEIVDFRTLNRLGQAVYLHGSNTILINSNSFQEAERNNRTPEETIAIMQEILTEELLHSVHVNALKQHGTVSVVDHGSYKENIFTPNADAPLFVTKLIALYNEAKAVLPYDGRDNYESKDIFEFMAGSFEHRNEYREKLNGIRDRNGKSLIERFMDVVGQAIQFLTNNYSAEVKATVIEIMNSNKSTSGTIKKEVSPLTKAPEIKLPSFNPPSPRPDISFIDSKIVVETLGKEGLTQDINDILKNIKDVSTISPENLLSLLEQKDIIKKEC